MHRFITWASLCICVCVSQLANSLPAETDGNSQANAIRPRMVFAHFMMGIVMNRGSSGDYDNDMQLAKAAGIDAFALNIGLDSGTEAQLSFAYESADRNQMKVFISFDFSLYKPGQEGNIGAMIAKFGGQHGQLLVDGKAFVSTFSGDGMNIDGIKNSAGMPIFFVPNLKAGSTGNLDGLFNWAAWPSNGNNKAPDGTAVTVFSGDQSYQRQLGNKAYMAPVSPWFSTHYGPSVPWAKNFVFPSDLLFYKRWNDLLNLAPPFIEIITWNDYGESSYVGPLSSPHGDDGASQTANDMPHDGFLAMAAPYISAYKAGAKKVDKYIKGDQLIYWYRPTTKAANCDDTDTCSGPPTTPNPNYFIGKPNGYNTMADEIFVVSMLTAPGTVIVNSGSIQKSFNAPTGISAYSVPMGTGKQAFALQRGGKSVLSGTSPKEIIDECVCGLYNFNAFVGTLPVGQPDSLQPDGLSKFSQGLRAACEAKPSLGLAANAAGPVELLDSNPSSGATSAVATTTGTGDPEQPVITTPPTTAGN